MRATALERSPEKEPLMMPRMAVPGWARQHVPKGLLRLWRGPACSLAVLCVLTVSTCPGNVVS